MSRMQTAVFERIEERESRAALEASIQAVSKLYRRRLRMSYVSLAMSLFTLCSIPYMVHVNHKTKELAALARHYAEQPRTVYVEPAMPCDSSRLKVAYKLAPQGGQ